MTETTSAKGARPAIEKPTGYFEVPTPAPNGHAPAAPLGVKSIESAPPKDPSDVILDAAAKILAAAKARIAYHDAQAKRLRDMCTAFAAIGMPRQVAAGEGDTVGADVLAKLISLTQNLPSNEEGL